MVNLRLPWLQNHYFQITFIVTSSLSHHHMCNHQKQKFHRTINVPESDARLHLFFFFLAAGLLMSFHGHSCPSIMIICIQPQSWAGVDTGMTLQVLFIYLFIYWATGMANISIGSGGTTAPPSNTAAFSFWMNPRFERIVWTDNSKTFHKKSSLLNS